MTIDRREADALHYVVQFNLNWVDLRHIPMHQLKHYLDNISVNLTKALLIPDAGNIDYLKEKVEAIERLYERRLESE